MSLLNQSPADNAEEADGKGAPAGDILQAAEAKVESQLTPQTRADYTRIVTAGMKLALDKGPNGIAAHLAKSQNPLEDCVKGAIGEIIALYRESRGTMPIKAAVPAAMTLMLKALQFAQTAKVLTVDRDTVIQATHLFTNMICKELGVTPQMMKTAAAGIQQLTKDPIAVEKIKRAAGVVKDPRSSTPTPIPEGDRPEEEEGANVPS